jgi:hypothetical protein
MSVVQLRRLVTAPRLSLAFVALLLVAGLLRIAIASADQLPTRSIELSNASAGAADTYKLGFDVPQTELLGSVTLQFCVESPLKGTPCTLPAGMDLSGAVLASQTGPGGFSVASISGTTITLGRIPVVYGPGAASFTFTGITNPSAVGSYFGRILTYASNDGTGGFSDYGGLAFSINSAVNITATVPPYLYFCVGITITGVDCTTAIGDQLDFGNFSPAIASVGQTQMVAGTNADTGYFIVVSGNTLTSGVNVIPSLTINDVSRPGVSQFGMNLVANTDPQVGQDPSGSGFGAPTAGYGTQNSYRFIPGDTVASVPLPDEARKYTASYVANVAKNQAAGVYVTTLTYIATGGF